MAQHSFPGRAPATLAGRPGAHPSAARRLLSLGILLALTGGLRAIYLAAIAPSLPAEAANVAHAYAMGHLSTFADAGGAGVSRFGWLQLAVYTMVSGAFGRADTAVTAVRETMLVAAVASAVLLWMLARRLGLTRWTATAAVALMAVSPLALGIQRLVVVEHLAVVWALAGLVLITTRRAKPRHDVVAALCLLAAVLTSPLALFVLPAACWLLVRRSPPRAALVAVLLNLGLGIAFGPAASILRPHLAAGGGPRVADWLAFDPALALLSSAALVAALFVVALRPLAVSGLLLVAALFLPGVPATAALAFLIPFAPLLVAGITQAITRQRRRPGHLWPPMSRRPAGLVASAAVLIGVIAASWLHGFTVLRPASTGPFEEAQNWLRDNASGSRLLVDEAAWSELAAAGWPTGMLGAPAACANRCPPADWAVLTGDPATLLRRYPDLGDAVSDSTKIAVFGSGDGRVTVSRLDLPPPDPAAPSEDSARAHGGAALIESSRITFTADAAAVLREGRLDPRLIATVAALAALGPVRVAGFPAVPGEDAAGQPRRRVLLTGDEDSAAAYYTGQRDLFRPSAVARTAGGVLVTYPLFPPTGLLVPFTSP